MAYVVLESSVRTHRKMLAAGGEACWLWVCGLGYCQEGLTDGHIPEAAVDFLGVRNNVRALAAVLVEVRLWDRVDDGWQVHDYHEHNKPADEVRRIMRARSEGGKLGGRPVKTLKVNLQGSDVSAKPRNLPRNPSGTSGTVRPTATTNRQVRAVSPSATPPATAVLTFPVTGDKANPEWALTPRYLADLQCDYEHLDVLAECKKASAWVKANPGRRKTANGMPKFIVNWLNRAVEQGGPRLSATPSQPTREPLGSWRDECAKVHGGRCTNQHFHLAQMAAGVAS